MGDLRPGTVERDKWDIKPPFTADNGYFFSADTIEELARKIEKGHEFQRVPLEHLAETVRKWNSYVDEGADPDFARGKDAPMHKIDKPPFYAAAICPVWHDSYGGLRINGKGQVLDTQGEASPASMPAARRAAAATSMGSGELWSTATSRARTPRGREPRSHMAPEGDVIRAQTTCAVRVTPDVVEANDEISLQVTVSCSPACDLRGHAPCRSRTRLARTSPVSSSPGSTAP